MLPDWRFLAGAAAAISLLGLTALGVLATVRLAHHAKMGPLETSRQAAFADPSEWNPFYDAQSTRLFGRLAPIEVAEPAIQPTGPDQAAIAPPPSVVPEPVAQTAARGDAVAPPAPSSPERSEIALVAPPTDTFTTSGRERSPFPVKPAELASAAPAIAAVQSLAVPERNAVPPSAPQPPAVATAPPPAEPKQATTTEPAPATAAPEPKAANATAAAVSASGPAGAAAAAVSTTAGGAIAPAAKRVPVYAKSDEGDPRAARTGRSALPKVIVKPKARAPAQRAVRATAVVRPRAYPAPRPQRLPRAGEFGPYFFGTNPWAQ